jgi:hypothetical protein
MTAYRLRLTRSNALKLKVLPRLMGQLAATSPLTLSQSNGISTYGLSITDLRESLDDIYALTPIDASNLPFPTTTTLGGVKSFAAQSNKWINALSTSGAYSATRPSFSDISGNIAVSQMDSGSSASNSTFWRGDGVWAAPAGSGNVTGSGSPTVGDLASFNNTGATAIVGTGYNAKQIPGLSPTSSNVTITNASPGVVTWNSHGLSANAPVFFATTGALPTGLTAATKSTGTQISPNTYQENPTLYYVVGSSITANTFTVATSIANAKAGTAVNTSSAGSGTHTCFANAMAPSGTVGELLYKVIEISPGVAATSGTEATWIQKDFTAGVWLVGGNYGIYGASGSPTFTDWHATIGYSVSGGFLTITSPYGGISAAHISTNQSNGIVLPFGQVPLFLTSTTTISSAAKVNWTGGGTAVHYGSIWGLRIA